MLLHNPREVAQQQQLQQVCQLFQRQLSQCQLGTRHQQCTHQCLNLRAVERAEIHGAVQMSVLLGGEACLLVVWHTIIARYAPATT